MQTVRMIYDGTRTICGDSAAPVVFVSGILVTSVTVLSITAKYRCSDVDSTPVYYRDMFRHFSDQLQGSRTNCSEINVVCSN
jgi:hypothetical protein